MSKEVLWLFIIFSLVIFQFGSPRSVHAGIFSFLEKIFKSDQVEIEKTQNSQTLVLLEPVLNSNSGSAVGNIDITVINQNALLPDTGPMGTISDIGETMPLNDRISIYIVRKGDNLSQIAKMFDVSVNTIIWANDLKNDGSLQIEQELIILPISGIQYTIQKGDTLKSIAQKFKSDADEIASFNDMNGPDSDLTIGETIIIPDGEFQTNKPPSDSNKKLPPKTTSKPLYAGYYIRPIEGGRKTQGIHGNNAIDLAASCDTTPVFASASGDIIISKTSGWNGGAGKYIVIQHSNNTQTMYAHLSRLVVSRGWHVVKGQIIGYVGTTGRSTGCHLHFGILGAKNPF